MTAVKFLFLFPDGTPIQDAPFYVTLRKAAYHDVKAGLVPPDVIEAVTDVDGVAHLELFPANQPYYVTMQLSGPQVGDECPLAALKFRIAVPDVDSEVNAHTLIVTDPIFSQAWDAAAIEAIMEAKAEAITAANDSRESADKAAVNEQNAANSASESLTQANRAETQANVAQGFAGTASNSAAASSASAADSLAQAQQSANSASASAAARDASQGFSEASELSASHAAASETNASGSATAAQSSASNSAISAAASEASSQAADASKLGAANQASAASVSATEASAAKDAAEDARDVALSAAASMTGSIVDGGAVNLSGGAYPPKPDKSTAWKVTVAGVVSGVDYGVGDTLVYTKTLDQFYKIDNTEAVTSVNGKQGVVVLGKGDVGLGNADNTPDVNKPISIPQQAALDTKVDKVSGKQLSTEDYTTAEKNKLSNVATGATANASDAALRDRSTHTGTQLASTISDLAAAVRSTVLTGLAAGANTVISATDSIIVALANLQSQISARLPLAGGNMTGALNAAPMVSLPASSVTDLASVNTNIVNLATAGGTITAFTPTTLPTGSIRTLRFYSGGATIQSNANITTFGGRDMNISMGDILVIYKNSASNWIVIGYVPGDGSGFSSTQSVSAVAGVLDLSAVTARTVVVSLTTNVTSITLPTTTPLGKHRELDIIFLNTGNFTVTGWPAATVFEAAAARPVRLGVGARTDYRLSRTNSNAWFVYDERKGDGQYMLRCSAATGRAMVAGVSSGGVLTVTSLVTARVAIVPFTVARPMKISALGIRVSTSSVTSFMTAGIYDNNGDPTGLTDLPGTLLAQTPKGGIAVSPVGNQQAACDAYLRPGHVYWAALVSNASNSIFHIPTTALNPIMGYNQAGGALFCSYLTYDSSPNVLPAVLDTANLTEQTGNVPAIYLFEDTTLLV